jgi:UDP-N-acetylglucosamine 4-epimerase
MKKLENSKVLVTGGAGFIGSNLIEVLLKQGNHVICMDNFITGKRENIEPFMGSRSFELIEKDIRELAACHEACAGVKYVLHQAALGSVPRSIEDPVSSAEINISGFVNMLFAAQKAGVKRFVYAASSSTYGDSRALPKTEDDIGKPLSPYAITKYVNELYAENFSRIYGIETIGLRYFNVFGKHQDPEGAYAAVIPKFVSSLVNHRAPVINGDGSNSRDFTYVDNVVQANQLAALVENPDALNTVYNVACGGRTSLNELFIELRDNLSKFDPAIADIEAQHGPERPGDIPHSQASIDKAGKLLGYVPEYGFKEGLREASAWYFENLTRISI